MAADGAPAAQPPGAPLPALPYHLDDVVGWSLEVRLILVSAATSAAFSLMSFATSIWIHVQPGLFRSVGGFQSLTSLEFALASGRCVLDVAVITGVAAVFARRRVGRPLLLGGSAGVIAFTAVAFVYYAWFSGKYGADLLVWSLWRAHWLFSMAVLPFLTLVVMNRPLVKARFRPVE
jgi:hypothetical protein